MNHNYYKPLISVVIPLYNKERHIGRTLRSVLAQTRQDFEIIVVNDGSTDTSLREVAVFTDPRLQCVSQPNAGPGCARNTGLSMARGQYISFLDADDEWRPTFLERTVELLDAEPEAACVSTGLEDPNIPVRELRKLLDRWMICDGRHDSHPESDPRRLVYLLAYISPCNTLIRREVAREHGGFFSAHRCLYGEDAFLWLKVLLNHTVLVSREPLAIYHTEASDLAQDFDRPYPVEPFFSHYSELRNACPQNKINLLDTILAIRAQQTVRIHAVHGEGKKVAHLMFTFGQKSINYLYFYTMILLASSPLLPPVRRIYRHIKSYL